MRIPNAVHCALLVVLASVAVASIAMRSATAASAESSEPLRPYVAALRSTLDARAATALDRIDGVGRQLLAIRSYLRSGPDLGHRWSWTEQQIQAFEGSAEQQALLREIGIVRATFERMNPGYTLFVNERVRSLDEQLEQWNRNDSVAAAASNLESATAALLEASGWPPAGTDRTLRRLAEFLSSHKPDPTPTLAAPGLSAHGQMNAVDFHVYRGDTPVAEPEASTIASTWDAQGWSERLRLAISESGAKFRGPLTQPREPWHYEYAPACCMAPP